jgi:hypothetical protein
VTYPTDNSIKKEPLKRWSSEDIRRARQRELAPLLSAMGVILQPLEDGNVRLVGESGNVIIKDHYWIKTDTGESGNTIDFFVKIRGMSFVETMRLLLQ